MPELLSASVHYMIYQSQGLVTGKNVTARVSDPPDFIPGDALPLSDIGGGNYKLSIDFTREGLYLAQFFEDGVPTTTQTYRVYRVRDILGELESSAVSKARFQI